MCLPREDRRDNNHLPACTAGRASSHVQHGRSATCAASRFVKDLELMFLWKPSFCACVRQSPSLPVCFMALAFILCLAVATGIQEPLLACLFAAVGLLELHGWYHTTACKIIRERKEPFCIKCGYNLTASLEAGRCPECGWSIVEADIDAYRMHAGTSRSRPKLG